MGAIAALVLTAAAATGAAAEEPRRNPAAPAPKQQQQQQQQQQIPVSLEQALYLIRSTLLALNDANLTGNYTVLRDLAALSFQARNSAADLAQIFANLRARRFDLFQVALLAPQLSAPPRLENNRMLRLTGYFPTQPLQINFDLLFENVSDHWRLFEITVQTPPAAAQPDMPPAAKK